MKVGPPTAPSSSQNESSRGKRDARHLKQDVRRTKAQFRYTLHTLEFKDAALEYYCSLSSQDQLPFLSKLSRMNRGYLDGKHSIPGTNPKVFELEAGKAGRIYYRRHDGATRVLIERIGNKRESQRHRLCGTTWTERADGAWAGDAGPGIKNEGAQVRIF